MGSLRKNISIRLDQDDVWEALPNKSKWVQSIIDEKLILKIPTLTEDDIIRIVEARFQGYQLVKKEPIIESLKSIDFDSALSSLLGG